MALEEDLIRYRMISDKVQVLAGALASGAIKDEKKYSQIEDILVNTLLEYNEQ